MAAAVQVCCRFRPLNRLEREQESLEANPALPKVIDLHPEANAVSVCKPSQATSGNLADTSFTGLSATTNERVTFSFDRVFEPGATQQQVFDATAGPMAKEVLDGYNCTVFAYGQTGSGKTHTMMGYSQAGIAEATGGGDADAADAPVAAGAAPAVGDASVLDSPGLSDDEPMDFAMSAWQDESEMGIIPRLVRAIFDGIEVADEMLDFTVQVSYVEIYLERIRDLLNPDNASDLKIRESKQVGIYIDGVTDFYVGSFEEVLTIMREGESNRSVAATRMNAKSSRSHSVFILTVRQSHRKTGAKKAAKLVLVDLAGSEKVRKTGASGLVLEQAKHTNKSLAALGNVINSLTEGRAHVPYRDSKLTRLLTDSLGGNSKTCLIVTCSPSEYNIDETYSTLRFGVRAKRIKNKPKVNRQRTVAEYKALLSEARQKIQQQSHLIASLERDLDQLFRHCREHNIDLSEFEAVQVELMKRLKKRKRREKKERELRLQEASLAKAAAQDPSALDHEVNELVTHLDLDIEVDEEEDDDDDDDSPPRSEYSSPSNLDDDDTTFRTNSVFVRDMYSPSPVPTPSSGPPNSKLLAQVAELKSQVVVLEHHMAAEQATAEQLRHAVAARERELERTQSDNLALKSEKNRSRKRAKDLELSVLEVKEELARLTLLKKTAELKQAEQTLLVEELQADIESLRKSNARLTARLELSEQETTALKAENLALGDEMAQVKQARAVLEQELRRSRRRLRTASNRVDSDHDEDGTAAPLGIAPCSDAPVVSLTLPQMRPNEIEIDSLSISASSAMGFSSDCLSKPTSGDLSAFSSQSGGDTHRSNRGSDGNRLTIYEVDADEVSAASASVHDEDDHADSAEDGDGEGEGDADDALGNHRHSPQTRRKASSTKLRKLQKQYDANQAKLVEYKKELAEVRAEQVKATTELHDKKAQYDRILLDYEQQVGEALRLKMQNASLREHLDSKVSAPLRVSTNGTSASDEAREWLFADLQRKCDENVQLQLEKDDLEFRVTQQEIKIARLEKQLRLRNQDVQQVLRAHSGGTAPNTSTDDAEGDDDVDENKLHEHFKQLRAAVQKLRTRNEKLRRQDEYHMRVIDNKQEHIEVLELALRDSNMLHREQITKHATEREQMQAEIARLREQVDSLQFAAQREEAAKRNDSSLMQPTSTEEVEPEGEGASEPGAPGSPEGEGEGADDEAAGPASPSAAASRRPRSVRRGSVVGDSPSQGQRKARIIVPISGGKKQSWFSSLWGADKRSPDRKAGKRKDRARGET